MKKISKVDLVAAVAVAGFNTANAQPLEEAIKKCRCIWISCFIDITTTMMKSME